MRARTRLAAALATATLSTVTMAAPAAAHVTTCAVVGPIVVSGGGFEGDLLGVCADGTRPIRLSGWISGACGNEIGFGFADDGVSSHFFVLVGTNGLAWALAGQADGALSLLPQGACSESGTTFATHGSLTFL